MNASEAKQVTKEALTGPSIQPFLDIIYTKIKEAASNGQTSVVYGFSGYRMVGPNFNQDKAIRDHLEKVDGYTLKYHDNYDCRDPRERPYHSISW